MTSLPAISRRPAPTKNHQQPVKLFSKNIIYVAKKNCRKQAKDYRINFHIALHQPIAGSQGKRSYCQSNDVWLISASKLAKGNGSMSAILCDKDCWIDSIYKALPINPNFHKHRLRSSRSRDFGTSWMGLLMSTLLIPSWLLGSTSDARMTPHLASVMQRPTGRRALIESGHSHNDYHQADPLSSALRHGIKSVEVDVFPRNDQLLVAHTIFELDSSKTIESLYISPILRLLKRKGRATSDPRITNNEDSRPFPTTKRSKSNEDGLTLMVDFKADAEKSVSLLKDMLAPLRPFLTKVDKHGNLKKGKLTILVSGNRPKAESLVTPEGERFIFIDGRAKDIYSNTDTNLVPMVSIPWRNVQMANWMGRGEKYMRGMADKAHSQGKQLRIWGAPNTEQLWRQLLQHNVDVLSIDDHAKYVRFTSGFGR